MSKVTRGEKERASIRNFYKTKRSKKGRKAKKPKIGLCALALSLVVPATEIVLDEEERRVRELLDGPVLCPGGCGGTCMWHLPPDDYQDFMYDVNADYDYDLMANNHEYEVKQAPPTPAIPMMIAPPVTVPPVGNLD